MRPIIFKQITEVDGFEKLSVYFLGLLVYAHEYPIEKDEKKHPIGFVQYPIEAPSEVYDYEDDYLE